MNTPTKQQPTFLEKVKSAAEQKFLASKATAIDLANRCKSIAIKDDTTLAMANQVLSQANSQLKMLEDKRKELKTPYHEAGKLIDTVAKGISVPLEAGISAGKLELRKWNDEQERIKKEKTEMLNKQQDFLQQMETNLLKKSDECASVDSCDKLINSINEKFPVYEKQLTMFLPEVTEMKERYLALVTTKRRLIEKAVASGIGSTQAIADIQTKTAEAGAAVHEKMQEAIAKTEIMQQAIQDSAVIGNTRKVWKAEVVDESVVPKEWLCVDMDKVNAYLKNVVRVKGEEVTVNGVRFFIDKTPMIR